VDNGSITQDETGDLFDDDTVVNGEFEKQLSLLIYERCRFIKIGYAFNSDYLYAEYAGAAAFHYRC
jgi:hypothetical protein